MIFRGWYLFWYKKTSKEWVYTKYDMEHATLFIRNALAYTKFIGFMDNAARMENGDWLLSVSEAEKDHNVVIDVKECDNPDWEGYHDVAIYKKEPDYVFPEWIRKMMAGCIYCFASFYGTLIFTVFHLLCGEEVYYNMYGWSANPLALLIFTYIAFLISLSYMNGLFNKPIEK